MDCQQLIEDGYASITFSTDLAEPNQNILLVEDERLVREVAGEVLKSAGYRVWKAACAEEALQLFERHSKDIRLLITDLVLPDDRGPELAEKLRRSGGWFRTILMSGYPERMITTSIHATSAFFYLSKPFSAQMLIGKVRQVLSLQALAASSRQFR